MNSAFSTCNKNAVSIKPQFSPVICDDNFFFFYFTGLKWKYKSYVSMTDYVQTASYLPTPDYVTVTSNYLTIGFRDPFILLLPQV